jgi:hypothetical protein
MTGMMVSSQIRATAELLEHAKPRSRENNASYCPPESGVVYVSPAGFKPESSSFEPSSVSKRTGLRPRSSAAMTGMMVSSQIRATAELLEHAKPRKQRFTLPAGVGRRVRLPGKF